MDFYWLVFFCGAVVAVLLSYINCRNGFNKSIDQGEFQRQYLVVYTLAYFADWLKGPYVYALYESYKLTEQDIALLFIVGFGISGISGPFVGVLADRFGRKRCVIAYFVVYIASALCMAFPEFIWLVFGRILGGIGTSLLTTTLESWMVSEHRRQNFPQELLDDTFAKATLCNSGSAILAGLLAQATADRFGYLAPYMTAIIPLTIGMVICERSWATDSSKCGRSVFAEFQEGIDSMTYNMWILGVTQSLFLGAMYTFVFLWTPAMNVSDKDIPHGLVFSIFMVMISIGSAIFKRVALHVDKIPYVIFGGGALLMGIVSWSMEQKTTTFISFALFELICGVMFPTFGSLRATYIPSEHRTTIMNVYRIPLNVFVVVVLLNKKNMSLPFAFGFCCVTLFAAAIIWRYFVPKTRISTGKHGRSNQEEEDFGVLEDSHDIEDDIEDDIESDISDSDEQN